MHFGLSEEQTLLQDNINRYLADTVPLDQVRKFAAGEIDNRAIWNGLSELGVAGLLIDEKHGGVGLGSLDAVVVADCLGGHVTPDAFLGTAMASRALAASDRDDLLGELAAGEIRFGIAFSESVGARGDAGVIIENGRLNGKSILVVDPDADWFIVATPDQQIALVSRTEVTIEPMTTIDKSRRTCSLTYKGSVAKILSDDPDVYRKALDTGRLVLAADTLGAAQYMLDAAVDYAKQREQFNRPIGSFQAVKHLCAEMAADLEPARSLVWYAGHALDHVAIEARESVCHAKAHLAEIGTRIAKTATEVHGGMGFTDLLGLHYWFKRIGFNRQLLGSPELVRAEAANLAINVE